MKKIKQSVKARILTITAIILLVIIGICNVAVSVTSSNLEDELETKYDLYVLSETFRNSSEFLTRKARSYACTGEKSYLDEYNNELNTNKGRETSLAAMQEIGITDEEQAFMDEINSISSALAVIEAESFTYVAKGDYSTAYGMLYDADYVKQSNKVSSLIDDFDDSVSSRMNDKIAQNNTICNIADVVTYVSIVVAFILQMMVMTFVLKELIAPIIKIKDKMHDFLEGDMHSEFDIAVDDTEIGQTADSVRTFQKYQSEIIDDINYLLGEMSNGNFVLKTRCEENYKGDYRGVLLSIRQINRKLSATLTEIANAAEQVDSGAAQVSAASVSLSQGATEQASSIQELSSTINVISKMISDNADNAVIADEKTTDAGNELAIANEKIKELVGAMNEISTSSDETKKIIKTIEDIAFQTNILALNAAVEAARAGAAGKGFAVVADEVRNLAGKSAEAATQTTALIESTVSAIEKGSSIVNEVAEDMTNVALGAGEVAKINVKIASDSKEAAESVRQVTIGIEQIATVVQTNSATSEETAAASEELSAQSDTCRSLVSQFNLRTDC